MSGLAMEAGMHVDIPSGDNTTRIVLLAICRTANADDGFSCKPFVRTIAEIARVCERTARKHIRILEEDGLVEVTSRRHQRGGWQVANAYRLTFCDGVLEAVKSVKPLKPRPGTQVPPPETSARQELVPGSSPARCYRHTKKNLKGSIEKVPPPDLHNSVDNDPPKEPECALSAHTPICEREAEPPIGGEGLVFNEGVRERVYKGLTALVAELKGGGSHEAHTSQDR